MALRVLDMAVAAVAGAFVGNGYLAVNGPQRKSINTVVIEELVEIAAGKMRCKGVNKYLATHLDMFCIV